MTKDCPDPKHCPVVNPTRLAGARTTTTVNGQSWHRAYEAKWGYDEFHPGGGGDSRFAPFTSAAGTNVPTLYLAETGVAALLETVFHDVHPLSKGLVYESDVRERLLVTVSLPSPPVLLDLRDPELQRLNVSRHEVVSSPAEHFPCTRAVARAVHARHDRVDGIVWHSRQAELASHPPAQVMVLFGDHYGTARGKLPLAGPGSVDLLNGRGRDLVDQIAVALGATIVPLS